MEMDDPEPDVAEALEMRTKHLPLHGYTLERLVRDFNDPFLSQMLPFGRPLAPWARILTKQR